MAANIIHEDGNFFVVKTDKGFEVYRNTNTHAVRRAIIGFKGDEGMRRALAEIERRKHIE